MLRPSLFHIGPFRDCVLDGRSGREAKAGKKKPLILVVDYGEMPEHILWPPDWWDVDRGGSLG